MERTAFDIGLHVNADKTEYMCFNQRGGISTLKGGPLKLVAKFTYLGSSISSNETDINTRLAKAMTAIDRLSVIWKSDLTKIKRSFFQAVVMSTLLYGCTTWMQAKEKAWQQWHKNATSNFEQVLETTPSKAAAVRPSTTHHENYPSYANQTCRKLL